jgi:hypothetical protein
VEPTSWRRRNGSWHGVPLRPGLRQTHQALILGFVVPVREKDGQQPKGIDVRARCTALGRIDRVELEEGPALLLVRLDGASGEFLLHRHPLEVFSRVGIHDTLV